MFECQHCPRVFSEKPALYRHIRNFHPEKWTGPEKRKAQNHISTQQAKLQKVYQQPSPQFEQCQQLPFPQQFQHSHDFQYLLFQQPPFLPVQQPQFQQSQQVQQPQHVQQQQPLVQQPKQQRNVGSKFLCRFCNKDFKRWANMNLHMESSHPEFVGGRKSTEALKRYRPYENRKAKKKISIYEAKSIPTETDIRAIDELILEIKERTAERLNTELREHKQGIKYQLSIQTVFKRDVAGDDGGKGETTVDRPTYFNSKTHEYGTAYAEIEQTMDELPNNFNNFVEDFESAGSGWTLFFIQHVELKIYNFDVIKGGKYIPLPSKIEKKRACINVENIDEYCFKWALCQQYIIKIFLIIMKVLQSTVNTQMN